MYHEEKIIDGVLCWRGTPDGEWQQYSKVELTSKWKQEHNGRLDALHDLAELEFNS